jgi:hypothetical protein
MHRMEKGRVRMRRELIVCGALALGACTGEKPAPATPRPDTLAVPATADSARRRDSAAPHGDSIMVRDTAKGI